MICSKCGKEIYLEEQLDRTTSAIQHSTCPQPTMPNNPESDTPRTDANILGVFSHPHLEYVDSTFARQLERELNETKKVKACLVHGKFEGAVCPVCCKPANAHTATEKQLNNVLCSDLQHCQAENDQLRQQLTILQPDKARQDEQHC